MRRTTETIISRIKAIIDERNKLNKISFRKKSEENKLTVLREEIEALSVQFGDIFDMNLSHKKMLLEQEKQAYFEKLDLEFQQKLEVEKKELSKTIEFQQLAVGGLIQKIKHDTAMAHLVIMDVIKSEIINKVSTTLNFISQNKTEYLKESIVSEALMQGADINTKGALVVPPNIPEDLKEKLKVYGYNVEFKLFKKNAKIKKT